MLLFAGVLPTAAASCAVGVDCEDTVATPDLGWLIPPAVALVVLVVVHYARRGGRGL